MAPVLMTPPTRVALLAPGASLAPVAPSAVLPLTIVPPAPQPPTARAGTPSPLWPTGVLVPMPSVASDATAAHPRSAPPGSMPPSAWATAPHRALSGRLRGSIRVEVIDESAASPDDDGGWRADARAVEPRAVDETASPFAASPAALFPPRSRPRGGHIPPAVSEVDAATHRLERDAAPLETGEDPLAGDATLDAVAGNTPGPWPALPRRPAPLDPVWSDPTIRERRLRRLRAELRGEPWNG